MNGARENELEDLFAAYVDRLADGERLDPETILAENPLLGQLWVEGRLGPGLDAASRGGLRADSLRGRPRALLQLGGACRGGRGEIDIWVARRPDPDAPWGDPENCASIDTSAPEAAPSVSPDGLAILFGRGEGDFRWATRSSRDVSFDPARELGPPVNSNLWEGHSRFSHDWPAAGSLLYFTRGASRADFDIHQATWEPMPSPRFIRGECNDDGQVDLSDAVGTLDWLFQGRAGCWRSGVDSACPTAGSVAPV